MAVHGKKSVIKYSQMLTSNLLGCDLSTNCADLQQVGQSTGNVSDYKVPLHWKDRHTNYKHACAQTGKEPLGDI